MDSVHSDQPKYEDVQLPTGPLEGVKIEPELFIEQESFTIPVPSSQPVAKTDEPSTKKRKTTGLLSYEDWEEARKEGELYLLADSPNPNQPRPKAAAIRYRTKPSGGVAAEFATPTITSTTTKCSAPSPDSRVSTLSVANQEEIDSLEAGEEEFVSTQNVQH